MIICFDSRVAEDLGIMEAILINFLGDCAANPDARRNDGDWVLLTDKGIARELRMPTELPSIAFTMMRLEFEGYIERRYTNTEHLGYWVSLTDKGRTLAGVDRSWDDGCI